MVSVMTTQAVPYAQETLQAKGPQRVFGSEAIQVAMPIGGIGAGNICLNASGGLQDFAIRNRPATSALPDGHSATDSAFALLHIKATGGTKQPVTRLVEGPF